MEKIIQFLSSLPSTSAVQVKITDGLVTNLWNVLLHPPLSYVGDLYQYRAADGSNNVRSLFPNSNFRISCILILGSQAPSMPKA